MCFSVDLNSGSLTSTFSLLGAPRILLAPICPPTFAGCWDILCTQMSPLQCTAGKSLLNPQIMSFNINNLNIDWTGGHWNSSNKCDYLPSIFDVPGPAGGAGSPGPAFTRYHEITLASPLFYR